jgi:murein DD-endopeptidase MepM/ murein hydrolase activator NlpD
MGLGSTSLRRIMSSSVAYRSSVHASGHSIRTQDGRRLSLRRSTLVTVSFFLLLAITWAGVATWYIVTKDDLAARLIRRETARQYAYEDRIANLRHEIDRLSSRQLLDQDSVEFRLGELVSRQAQLETRQSIVAALASHLGSPAPAARSGARGLNEDIPQPGPLPMGGPALGFAPQTFSKPVPVPDAPPLRGAEKAVPGGLQAWQSSALPQDRSVNELLARVKGSLDGVEASQIASVQTFDTSVSEQHGLLRAVVAEVGLNPDRIAAAHKSSPQGGPFIPVTVDGSSGPFEAALTRLQPRLASVERLRSVVTALPLRRPMPSAYDQTSGFGHRLDPFTRSMALHSGIDFRAEHGTPVRAAAPGRVITAEHSGGYGNMVEVDHGNGLTTRYAHLSATLVEEGQMVVPGTVLGRVGSTGRSTGPHLHYETRIEGDAVDPTRFIRAGQRLAAQAPELMEAKAPAVRHAEAR